MTAAYTRGYQVKKPWFGFGILAHRSELAIAALSLQYGQSLTIRGGGAGCLEQQAFAGIDFVNFLRGCIHKARGAQKQVLKTSQGQSPGETDVLDIVVVA